MKKKDEKTIKSRVNLFKVPPNFPNLNRTNKFAIICFLVMIFMVSCKEQEPTHNEIVRFDEQWVFNPRDDMAFASNDYDDASWKPISPKNYWERQGYPDHEGFAWYRVHFHLPSVLKKDAYLKDSVEIVLGYIDDSDQTFLNGELIGVNNQPVAPGTKPDDSYTGGEESYRLFRRYVIPSDHPSINWDGDNVLAVRVHDHYLNGGFRTHAVQYVGMVDLKNYIRFDLESHGFDRISNEEFGKKIGISNNFREDVSGKLVFQVKEFISGEIKYRDEQELELKKGMSTEMNYQFKVDQTKMHEVSITFQKKNTNNLIVHEMPVPYFLTPPVGPEPKINGPKIYGQRPGREFLYAIPATGEKPLKYQVDNLPEGLVVDENTGIITGKVEQAGEYSVEFIVSNDKGSASREMRFIIGDKLALTPPMGWNSWNAFGLNVSAEKVRVAIDQFVEAGLKDHGYSFVNIDDGWEADERTPEGVLKGNEKFPDFKGLADYAHSKGLKLGIYSSPGPLTCGGYLGSYNYEKIDAETWAEWGIDYLKHDWCSYGEITENETELAELQKPYLIMEEALESVDRDIVYSLCQYGMGDVWKWGEDVGGNLWRTTGDIVDTWLSLYNIGFGQAGLSEYAKPGHWNDPDMMIVGWVGWNESIRPTRLTASEQYTHVTLWSILAAPLLLGNDLTKLDDFTLNLITNDEVIAVNQDPLGKQGDRVLEDGKIQVWSKPLEDGSVAVGIFNVGIDNLDYSLSFADIGLEGKVKVRDIWRNKNLGEFTGSFDTRIMTHGVTFIKVEKTQ